MAAAAVARSGRPTRRSRRPDATCGITRERAGLPTPTARRTSRSARRAAPGAIAAGGATRSTARRVVIAEPRVRGGERGHKSGGERRQCRAACREECHAPVHRHLAEHLGRRGRDRQERRKQPGAHRDRHDHAERIEDRDFQQHEPRQRPACAPIARRSASSPLREVTCASVRLAMLHDAISRSTSTPQNRTLSGARNAPYCQSRKVRRPPVHPSCVRGSSLGKSTKNLADLPVRLLERHAVGELRNRDNVRPAVVRRRVR